MQKRVMIGALTTLFFALILSLSLGREHYEVSVNNRLAVNNAKLTNEISEPNDCADSLDKHLDEIEKQISKIESEITSKYTTDTMSILTPTDSVINSILKLEANIASLNEISTELKNVHTQLEKENYINSEYAQRQNTLTTKVEAIENSIDSLTLMLESEICTVISNVDAIASDVASLQEKLTILEEKNANLEATLTTYIIDSSQSKESNNTDYSQQPTEDEPTQNPTSGDNQDNTAVENEDEHKSILFTSIDALSEDAIFLSTTAGQSYYYKVDLYSESFRFELSEYVFEPTIGFFQDSQMSIPIELEDGCLLEPYCGSIYIVIYSEFDDEIVFYLRSI